MTLAARESVSAFDPSKPFPVETGMGRMTDEDFQKYMSHGYSAPLWSIPDKQKQYKVSKPIKLKIYIEDDHFFVENETLVIIGIGKSVTDAIDDFGRQVIHFYKYYNKLSWDKVTGDAERLKGIYETLFIDQIQ